MPFRRHDGYVSVTVRLTPNGGRDAIDGVETDALGGRHLKVRVRAVPEKGLANKAVVAKAAGVAKSAVTLVSGETQRKKILRIDGDPEDIVRRLGA